MTAHSPNTPQAKNPRKNPRKNLGIIQGTTWRKFIPLLVLAVGLIAILYGLDAYGIGFDDQFWLRLADNYHAIGDWISHNLLLASIGFFALYAVAVAFSVPGALFLTLTAGALFGWLAGLIVVTAATLGALVVFLAARGALADTLARSSSAFIGKVKAGFDTSPFFWLLALRLMPVAPFWAVNIIPGLLGMRLIPYAGATALGIIPGSLVYVYAGIGFAEILAQGRAPSVDNLTDHRIFGPLLALSLLAVIPAVVRTIQTSRQKSRQQAS